MVGPPTGTSLSGLNEDEARSFHRMFVTSFIVFTLIAVVAHWAVWQWRPWIPGVSGYPATGAVPTAVHGATTVVASTTP